jgi:hypothetical protein
MILLADLREATGDKYVQELNIQYLNTNESAGCIAGNNSLSGICAILAN